MIKKLFQGVQSRNGMICLRMAERISLTSTAWEDCPHRQQHGRYTFKRYSYLDPTVLICHAVIFVYSGP